MVVTNICGSDQVSNITGRREKEKGGEGSRRERGERRESKAGERAGRGEGRGGSMLMNMASTW